MLSFFHETNSQEEEAMAIHVFDWRLEVFGSNPDFLRAIKQRNISVRAGFRPSVQHQPSAHVPSFQDSSHMAGPRPSNQPHSECARIKSFTPATRNLLSVRNW